MSGFSPKRKESRDKGLNLVVLNRMAKMENRMGDSRETDLGFRLGIVREKVPNFIPRFRNSV